MESLKEYLKLYPADTGKISKQSKRLEHIIKELTQYNSLEVESQEVFDEFMGHIKQLNDLSKRVHVGKGKWYSKS
jgi:hypothetical protein